MKLILFLCQKIIHEKKGHLIKKKNNKKKKI